MKHKRLTTLLLVIGLILTLCACNKTSQTKAEFTEFTDKEIATMLSSYSQYITTNNYENITYEIINDYTVNEDDIEKGMINALKSIAIETEIKNRQSQIGDTVNISYHGTIDGESFHGSDTPEDGINLVLGYSNFVDNFESKIVGMNVGETRTITINYPANYGQTTVNGKTAEFNVTLNAIYEYKLPELTDELIKEHSSYNTVEEMKTACKTILEEEYAARYKTELLDSIIDQLIQNTTYNGYPEDELQHYADCMHMIAENNAEMNGMDKLEMIETIYGVSTIDEFNESIKQDGYEYLQIKMALYEFANINNITITAKEFNEYRNQFLIDMNMSIEELMEYYNENDLLYNCLLMKLDKWIIEKAGGNAQ